ncbi:MAG: helix-turn-helix domain-containing protein [Nanobdellota archaeon]
MMALSFACKQIDFKDIIMCSFSLNKTEYNLFIFLLSQDDPVCTSTIGEMTGKDRTTIQKAIKGLVSKDLVYKHQVNLDSGGYTFVYSIKDKNELKQKLLDIVNRWHESVVKYINKW